MFIFLRRPIFSIENTRANNDDDDDYLYAQKYVYENLFIFLDALPYPRTIGDLKNMQIVRIYQFLIKMKKCTDGEVSKLPIEKALIQANMNLEECEYTIFVWINLKASVEKRVKEKYILKTTYGYTNSAIKSLKFLAWQCIR